MWTDVPDGHKLYVRTIFSRSGSYTYAQQDLTQPIDVHYDWIDACDAVAKDQASAGEDLPLPAARPRQANGGPRAGLAPGEKYTAEDDGFIDDDEDDAEAEFLGED